MNKTNYSEHLSITKLDKEWVLYRVFNMIYIFLNCFRLFRLSSILLLAELDI